MRRYQVTVTVTAIDSRLEDKVELPRFQQSPAEFFRVLAMAAEKANLTFQVRDDTTKRFAIKTNPETKEPYERGSCGYYLMGKIELGEGN